MGSGDEQDSGFGEPRPVRDPRVVRAPRPVLVPVSMSDIFQAAVNQAIQDYELNRLFNPDYYDYEI
jgi:hypothetical protein